MRGLQQRGERRIAAALRIALVVLLLALQVFVVALLAYLLEQRAAIVYAILQAAGLVVAVSVYNRPGDAMYKFTWIMLILTVPVVGLILYMLWSGEAQRRRLQRRVSHPEEEPESARMRGELNLDRLARSSPGWARLARSLHRRGFPVYQNTRVEYLPEGKALLDSLIDACQRAGRT